MVYFCEKLDQMDLQTGKLNVIEYLFYIRDEKVLSRIESTIGEAQK